MSTGLVSLHSTVGVFCAAGGPHRKAESCGVRSQPSKWWTPLFGWSAEPDYIDSNTSETVSDSDRELDRARSRIEPGSFTEEKARRLRMMTSETASFHDKMYHSAIASRLASDFSSRSGR